MSAEQGGPARPGGAPEAGDRPGPEPGAVAAGAPAPAEGPGHPTSGPIDSPRLGVTIEVDRELCFGFGDCVDSAPDVFELDEEGKSVVVDPDGADLDDLLLAAQDCPVDAIFVTRPASGEQLYP